MTAAANDAPGPPKGALALLCVAQFIVVLDVTIVAVALPAIQRELRFSPEALQWVISSYTLTFGGFLLAAGRAGDLFGRRRVFIFGLALFGTASFACGLAWSAAVLVGFRAAQGVGAAMVAPSALSLLTATWSRSGARRRAVGVWTAAAAGGGASGWLLGGLLTETLGWTWVFLVNVPVAFAAIPLAPRLLRESRASRRPARLDPAGTVTATAGLALLVYGVIRAEQAGVAAPDTSAALLAATALLTAFIAIERRVREPLLPLRVLRSRAFATATMAAFALTAATTPPMFFSILYQQQILHLTAAETGLGCAPFNLAVIAGSTISPRMRRVSEPWVGMAVGLAGVAAGALILTGTTSETSYATHLLPAFLLMGLGLGCAAVASTASGTSALPADEQGLASGILNAAAQIGTVLGLAVLVSVAAAHTRSLGVDGSATLAGYHLAFAGAAVIAATTAVAATLVLADRRAWHGAEPLDERGECAATAAPPGCPP